MISLAEVNAAAERIGVPTEVIEKDYVICWILACLAESEFKEDVILYGGTAIKRIYFEGHRFSEDIDLMGTKLFEKRGLAERLSDALRDARAKINLVMEVDRGRILTSGTRTQIFVRYSGYDEIIGAPKEVRVDFAMGMELYGETREGRLFESYSDLKKRNVTFTVQTLNTILAEKMGLLMDTTRKEPRDLYDVWFLFNRLDQFEFNLDEVRRVFKGKYGIPLSFNVLKPHLENRLYKERWEVRLRKQIADLPVIDKVIKELQELGPRVLWDVG